MSKTAIQMENKRGECVPGIPHPLYGLRKQCTCGEKFWTLKGYHGHYAYEHALMGNKPL